jgi:acetylornithine deacetylase/succinyl-diaminopimelate desuccinylase-like protein
MTLLSIFIQTDDMNEKQFIEDIIQKVGPRKAGSESEANAQRLLYEYLSGFCDTVEREEFECALGAKFGSLKIFCVLYAVSVCVSIFSYEAALVLGLLNAVLFFLHFNSYRHILDFLYPKKKSSNVIGTIEPAGEVKHTVIISGHIDSTPEFIWWYYLKNCGVRIMIVCGMTFVLSPFVWMTLMILHQNTDVMWLRGVYGFLFAVIPLSVVFFKIHGEIVVDGAQDNLSGISVAVYTGKALKELNGNRLRHTRVKIISFGSEETGLRGSHAYVQRHLNELQQEDTILLNLDGILLKDELHILTAEPSCWVKHSVSESERLAQAFEECGVPYKCGALPVGATDASSFSRAGLKAVSVVGLALNGLHPTYHTRLDTVDKIDQDVLEKMKAVSVSYIRLIDEQFVTVG